MFYFDKIVWVLHRRFQCTSCKHTIAVIDPRLISQLPTRIAERFEFVTTNLGLGVHKSMVEAMSFMVMNSMLHGGFTRMINELLLIKYSKVKLAYYNHVYDKSKKRRIHVRTIKYLYS